MYQSVFSPVKLFLKNLLEYSFTIEGRLAGLNEIIGANRYNRFAGAGLKKKEQARCVKAVNDYLLPKMSKPVRIHFEWIEPNSRRDLDNIAAGTKFVCDALVATGILPNDNREWVKGIAHAFPEPDKAKPRVVVTLTEIAA